MIPTRKRKYRHQPHYLNGPASFPLSLTALPGFAESRTAAPNTPHLLLSLIESLSAGYPSARRQPVHRPVAGSDSVKASLRLPFQSLESKPY